MYRVHHHLRMIKNQKVRPSANTHKKRDPADASRILVNFYHMLLYCGSSVRVLIGETDI